ncbi:hypothetical protein NA644_07440 [Pseudomonas stutzeri]|uniref:hypothetical protein n=1 Tax=Stutzerimonas stutzeri TaxID=316 RepID=UPI0011AFCA87|nr:hypothetical protein [Stutzerimonas stutzeri]MCQ4249142.1 hypothetical protein [Stutzerimonas stutzeri]
MPAAKRTRDHPIDTNQTVAHPTYSNRINLAWASHLLRSLGWAIFSFFNNAMVARVAAVPSTAVSWSRSTIFTGGLSSVCITAMAANPHIPKSDSHDAPRRNLAFQTEANRELLPECVLAHDALKPLGLRASHRHSKVAHCGIEAEANAQIAHLEWWKRIAATGCS